MLYFSEYNYRGNHAGTKARNDVEEILKRFGAKPINSRQFVLRSEGNEDYIQSSVKNRLDLFRMFFDVRRVRNEMVLVQYPMLGFDFQKKYLEEIRKHNKLVLLVHDLHSLRIPNEEKLKQEVEVLNLASVLILHNHFMIDKVQALGVSSPKMYSLELFDYLYSGEIKTNEKKLPKIAFAGNLGKSSFLIKMLNQNPGVVFQLYGNGWSKKDQYRNVNYIGSFLPDEIPGMLDACFGLVWDGESTECGEGPLGEYTRINNPHKMSLYLAAGIPVIVWSEAAVAELVQKYSLGITVERIDNLEEMIAAVTEVQYQEMKNNVLKYRETVLQGKHLIDVLNCIEEVKKWNP